MPPDGFEAITIDRQTFFKLRDEAKRRMILKQGKPCIPKLLRKLCEEFPKQESDTLDKPEWL